MNKVREKMNSVKLAQLKFPWCFSLSDWVKPECKASLYFAVFKHSFSKFRVVQKDCLYEM